MNFFFFVLVVLELARVRRKKKEEEIRERERESEVAEREGKREDKTNRVADPHRATYAQVAHPVCDMYLLKQPLFTLFFQIAPKTLQSRPCHKIL